LGTSQSGSRSHLRLLRVLRDEKMIEIARQEAASILASGIESKSLLERALAKLELDTATEFIDKS
jgi:ATP-dependent DNA helicase RecG